MSASVLDALLDAANRTVRELRSRRAVIEAAALSAPVPVSWRGVLAPATVAVVAEVKRRSPSSGAIAPSLDAAAQARAYQAGGAGAVSVLTEHEHFGGSIRDLEIVRSSVGIPILRKDFIIDPVQVAESRATGASAVLLIVRALDSLQMTDLAACARDWGLGRLIEVHDERELELALQLAPESVGVNSRDLATLEVHRGVHERVIPLVPSGIAVVAESGLRDRADVERVAGWGADAVLVGTAVSAASHPESAVRALTGVERHGR